ncbi:hypothetical protein ACW9UR_02875 [Halovulum sp. GXIMD14794]
MKHVLAGICIVAAGAVWAQTSAAQIRLEMAARCTGLGEALTAFYSVNGDSAAEMARLRDDAQAIFAVLLEDAKAEGVTPDLDAALGRQTEMRDWALRQAEQANDGTAAAPAAAEALSTEMQVCQALRAAYPQALSE